MHDMSTLTLEQLTAYASYYLVLRDVACNDDERTLHAFEDASSALGAEPATPEHFDAVCARVIATLAQ